MKSFLPGTFFLFFILTAHSQDGREMSKGAILNYSVKEGNISYKLKAMVIAWSPGVPVKVQWQTTGSKVMKGLTEIPRVNLEIATKLKIKLKPGSEKFQGNEIRWFASSDTYDDLSSAPTETEIDGKTVSLTADDSEEEKVVIYNNTKTPMKYLTATGSDAGKQVTLGLVEYTTNIIVLNNYTDGNFSINLVSIQKPLSEAEKFAREILDQLAPKSVVPLQKMEAAKFAAVKSKYPLLSTIENYDPTKGGKIKKPVTETYEYRYGSNSPNPPSLVDCLTADLKIIFNQATNFSIYDIENVGDKKLPAKAARTLLNVYVTKDFGSIPGYRPWTHWNFVRGLSEAQRTQLSAELEGYVSEYGFISQ